MLKRPGREALPCVREYSISPKADRSKRPEPSHVRPTGPALAVVGSHLGSMSAKGGLGLVVVCEAVDDRRHIQEPQRGWQPRDSKLT